MSFTAVKVLFLPPKVPKSRLANEAGEDAVYAHSVTSSPTFTSFRKCVSEFQLQMKFFLYFLFGDLQEGPFSGQFIKISPHVKIDVQVQHNDAKVLFERIFRWQLQNVLVSDSCHESQQFAIPFSVDIPQRRRRTKKQILVFSQRLDFLAFLGFFLEIREVLGRRRLG